MRIWVMCSRDEYCHKYQSARDGLYRIPPGSRNFGANAIRIFMVAKRSFADRISFDNIRVYLSYRQHRQRGATISSTTRFLFFMFMYKRKETPVRDVYNRSSWLCVGFDFLLSIRKVILVEYAFSLPTPYFVVHNSREIRHGTPPDTVNLNIFLYIAVP